MTITDGTKCPKCQGLATREYKSYEHVMINCEECDFGIIHDMTPEPDWLEFHKQHGRWPKKGEASEAITASTKLAFWLVKVGAVKLFEFIDPTKADGGRVITMYAVPVPFSGRMVNKMVYVEQYAEGSFDILITNGSNDIDTMLAAASEYVKA